MDDIVRQAMAKWPNVPHCFGWLALDQRGQWRMGDEAAQQAGRPGDPIRHAPLIDFINRNYACDDQGQWFFQNGPQRVYVELAYTPWVLRLAMQDGQPRCTDQAGGRFAPARCLLDDAGYVLLTEAPSAPWPTGRIGVLHDHDVGLLADATDLAEAADQARATVRWADGGTLPLERIARAEVARRFGFAPHPARA